MDLNELKKNENVKKLFDEVDEEYKLPEGVEFNNALDKRIELMACQMLLEYVEEIEGDEKDVRDILKYMFVVIDSKKHKLDWERAYTELDIDGKVEKYLGSAAKGEKEE